MRRVPDHMKPKTCLPPLKPTGFDFVLCFTYFFVCFCLQKQLVYLQTTLTNMCHESLCIFSWGKGRLAATCSCSHLKPLATTCNHLPKQPQMAASGCKWLLGQVAASGCRWLPPRAILKKKWFCKTFFFQDCLQ